jgi:hypothetical protein
MHSLPGGEIVPSSQYFLQMDQLIQKAGETMDVQLIAILEKNLSRGLIDKIFSAKEAPMTYQEWKRWATNYDNVWRRRQEQGREVPRFADQHPTNEPLTVM